MHPPPSRTLAVVALLLVIPASSVGVLAAMAFAPGSVGGQLTWALNKLWVFGVPLVWWLWVERGRWSWSPMRRGGAVAGLVTGGAILLIIVGAWLVAGRHMVDVPGARQRLMGFGLDTPTIYLAACAYWIFINSVLEEYLWRWFVYRQFTAFMGRMAAVIASGVAFTIHHTFALGFNFAWDWRIVLLGSLGVFVGGVTWSWLYARYESIWPGWISHALADVGVFTVGWMILFA